MAGGPQFLVADSLTGEVMYTKRATGVGTPAIESCCAKLKQLVERNKRAYFVYLDLGRVSRGSKVNVSWCRIMGITAEMNP